MEGGLRREEERGPLEKWKRGKKENKRRKKKRKRNKKKGEKKRGMHPRGRPNGRAGHCTRLRMQLFAVAPRAPGKDFSTRSCAPVQCPT